MSLFKSLSILQTAGEILVFTNFGVCKLFVSVLHVCGVLLRRFLCCNIEHLADLWDSSYSPWERYLLTDSALGGLIYPSFKD